MIKEKIYGERIHDPPYDVKKISEYILWWCNIYNKEMTLPKISNLLYIMWISYYQENEISLFAADFVANPRGVTINSLQERYENFGWNLPTLYIGTSEWYKIFKSTDIEFFENFLKKWEDYSDKGLSIIVCSEELWQRAEVGRTLKIETR